MGDITPESLPAVDHPDDGPDPQHEDADVSGDPIPETDIDVPDVDPDTSEPEEGDPQP